MPEPLTTPLALASVNHHTANIATLEAFRFPDEAALLREARERFKGALLLQTCNRVEVLVQGDARSLEGFLQERGRRGFAVIEGEAVAHHLLELAAGIDSLVVGEDQILGQLRRALATAQEAGAASSVIELCINKAVHVGVRVRRQTQINQGAVSVGSAAVTLAENLLGSLCDRHILVVGSGEMGLLVTQALAVKGLTAIYVANRTYEHAVMLADKIGGRAVNFKDLYRYIALSDVVISCTAAPHPVIRAEEVGKAMEERLWPLDPHPRHLVLIDIAQPRDVEEGVRSIEGVHLFTIDDLKNINDAAMDSRRSEADRARGIIDEELDHFIRLLRRTAADETLALLYTWAESIRARERDRALTRLGKEDDRTAEVIDDLTRALTKKLLADATASIRACAESGDIATAEALMRAITRGEPCFQNDE
ncbi:MAG: glutamyl-tRNA reductase [Methanoculleus sp.]|uniref:glutamyl-tRNA reductase n=3 Tax=Methanoculleus TaxID=45989 RepID=UPI0025CEA0CE|nr:MULTISPECIES: glutamyl-tRNA reductase [unclassified Methanoculleus]MCK9319179.1 glutamyl-tRNA reductase [Methanoculleus sp.]MDD2255112.1 glutamyl-tRNA reductase [Methanoculleus sp.]MDD4471612.1 glutamyl-tRNA reductase [Methanoculleus sp.]HOI57619.1 glutamyl-tRNA reductase [Methanoculleus sp.]